MAAHSPTVRRRRLSLVLLRLRKEAGLDSKEVARRLGWQASKLTRIERNEWKLPSVSDVMDLLDLYGLTDGTKQKAIITLAREARQRGWWEEFKDVLGGALPEFEAEASEIQTFEALLVPGLLQIPEYIAAVFGGGQALDESVIQRGVEARLTRQEILDRENPPELWAIIDESALRKHVGGPAVMRKQLHRLIEVAKRPNIGIQVVPDAVGAHASMVGAFTILNYSAPEDPSLVYVEVGSGGDLYLEKQEEVNRYRLKYDHVRASALSASDSVTYMGDLIEQLK